MKFKNNISYFRGNNQSISHPAHSRRFPRYASRHNIKFSDSVKTNFISKLNIITLSSDLTFWRKKINKNFKIIFDANDPFILNNDISFKDKFRGLFKYISGFQKKLELNYRDTYLRTCKESDLVICGHFKQFEILKKTIKNVVLIPDYGLNIKIKSKKNFELSKKDEINIFWEGLGSSFMPFKLIEEIFKPINNQYKFIFHFVTDLTFFKYGDRFIEKKIKDIARKESPLFFNQFKFYQWSEMMMNETAINCDFSIIPLPLDNSLNYWKPENKLIHMWRMSIPTIVSSIPSYQKVMNDSKLHFCANNNDQWRALILNLCKNKEIRKQNGISGKKYVDEFYSDKTIDLLWTNALSKL
tara:strand:+ start:502 stop:1569 length:1068 start_codon:yes stop_codon:yes gene_type:complete